MNKQHFTIGLAGHIDHGKTELVKALTNIDTDRLKEEKERQITIELGYAPLFSEEQLEVAMIDVPGHEKFIRQMIAGVSSIDLTLLVIAANEGIMPQTLEHFEVLKYLGLQNIMVVITKVDEVDEEFVSLVKEEVKELTQDTSFNDSPIFEVDSISKNGTEQLKRSIFNRLNQLESRSSEGHLFLPIDQSFHLHGIGTVSRGTISHGRVQDGQTVYLLPQGIKSQIKSIHHFNQTVKKAVAGQRAAIALHQVTPDDVKRGTVITDYPNAQPTNRIDVELNISFLMNVDLKQRAPIKLHTGTSEVYGRLIFFDRNKLTPNEQTVYAQVELDQPIYTLKNQRFILRRATPVQLIGGGKIIEPHATKHGHNQNTIEELRTKASFSDEGYILHLIHQKPGITIKQLGLMTESQINTLMDNGDVIRVDHAYYSSEFVNSLEEEVNQLLEQFHNVHPIQVGINKSELVSRLSLITEDTSHLIDYLVDREVIKQNKHFISKRDFVVQLSGQQEKVLKNILNALASHQLKVSSINTYIKKYNQMQLPDWLSYLTQQELVVHLSDDLYVERHVFERAVSLLDEQTSRMFEVGEAKEILGLSRKYIIPFLEKLDKLKYTVRIDNKRKWLT